jgi:alpha-beta hydrolase superfamily lysophospholipase
MIAEAVGRDWPEYEVRNSRRQLELGGATPAAVDAALMDKQSCMTRLLVEREPETQIERSNPACKDINSVYPVEPPYMQQIAAVNIIGLWQKIDVPVLAVYGESDFVTEAADHERIVAVVNARHPGYATYAPIAGMDHLLFEAPTPKAASDAFSSNAPRTYDTQLSRTIIAWLTQRTHG